MIDVICPHCKHVHKEDDSLVNWYWHCQECGELFRWNKFEAAQPSGQGKTHKHFYTDGYCECGHVLSHYPHG